jgi:multidrug efflux pump subunit AcrB
VAAPIEQQVIGTESALSFRSCCQSDGRYVLEIHFRRRMNLDLAQDLVRNRVALAEPALPEPVRTAGVRVSKALPEALAVVVVSSPTGQRDLPYVGDWADRVLRDRLLGVPGVAEATLIGRPLLETRFYCDTTRLERFDITATDVAKFVARANPGEPGERVANLDPAAREPLQRLADLGALEQRVVKTFPNGQEVRLADLGRIELGATSSSWASCRGRPVVLVVVRPTREVALPDALAAIGTTVAAADAPEGIELRLVELLEPAPGAAGLRPSTRVVRADAAFPDATPPEAVRAALERCASAVADPAVLRIVTLSASIEEPDRIQPALLVELVPGSATGAPRQSPEKRLGSLWNDQVPGVHFTFGSGSLDVPVTIAVCDTADHGLDDLRARATEWAQKLSLCPELAQVRVDPATESTAQLEIELDRAKAAALGVPPEEIWTTVRIGLGPLPVGIATGSPGDRFRVEMPTLAPGASLEDLLHLQIRTPGGQNVPLSVLVAFRRVLVPREITRLDGQPMVAIHAHPAAGDSPAAAQACDRLLRTTPPPDGYRIVRLADER